MHYNFTDIPSMKDQVAAGLFLEHAEVHGNMYGTSLAAVANVSNMGKHCVLDIDVQGAQQVRLMLNLSNTEKTNCPFILGACQSAWKHVWHKLGCCSKHQQHGQALCAGYQCAGSTAGELLHGWHHTVAIGSRRAGDVAATVYSTSRAWSIVPMPHDQQRQAKASALGHLLCSLAVPLPDICSFNPLTHTPA